MPSAERGGEEGEGEAMKRKTYAQVWDAAMARVEWDTSRHALPRIVKRPTVFASGKVRLGKFTLTAYKSTDGRVGLDSDQLDKLGLTYAAFKREVLRTAR